MKTIAKEKIDIFESVVFDEDGIRRLDMSADGFRVCALAARPIEKDEEVEFIFKTNKDFLLPEIKTKPVFITNVT
jgi:hypothetical protein